MFRLVNNRYPFDGRGNDLELNIVNNNRRANSEGTSALAASLIEDTLRPDSLKRIEICDILKHAWI